MEILIFVAILGCAIGFIGGYAGIGGAPLLVALMVMLLGISQYEAQGTVLAVMLGPMSLMGVLAMWDRVKLLWKYIAIGVISYAIFSYVGALGAFSIDEDLLKSLFGGLLLVLGLNELRGVRKLEKNQREAALNPDGITVAENAPIPTNFLTFSVTGILVGVVGGFFGIGAGVLMVPIFTSLFGIHKDDARALSLTILLPPVSIGAVIKYQAEGAIDWRMTALLFVAYFATNYFGARMGRKHNTRQFKKYFGFVLLSLAVAYFVLLLRNMAF